MCVVIIIIIKNFKRFKKWKRNSNNIEVMIGQEVKDGRLIHLTYFLYRQKKDSKRSEENGTEIT